MFYFFFLLFFCFVLSFRGSGGLHKTFFAARSFPRHTLSPAARHYIHAELQHQRDGGRGEGEEEGGREQGRVSNLHPNRVHGHGVSGTAQAGNAGPGQHGRRNKKCESHCIFVVLITGFGRYLVLVELLCIDHKVSSRQNNISYSHLNPPPASSLFPANVSL